jgi:hypothetical protein
MASARTSSELAGGYDDLRLRDNYSPRLSGLSTPLSGSSSPVLLTKPTPANDDEHDDDALEELELQENTFNRGSEGRGGWKMLGDEQGPSFQPLDRVELLWMTMSTLSVMARGVAPKASCT